MATFFRALRSPVRALMRSPGFTTVCVLTLALGIGAAAAIFSVVRGVLLEPLPYPEPGRIVQLWQLNDGGGQTQWSEPNFRDVRERSRSFGALAAYQPTSYTVSGVGDAERVSGAAVSEGFFSVLGVQPASGRAFSPDEYRDAAPVVVIGDGYSRLRLGGGRDVIGQTLTLDGRSYTVIGVLPPRLGFPADAELWIPRSVRADPSRTAHNWRVVGRLADGISHEEAQQELVGIATQLKQEWGDDTWMAGATAIALRDEIVGDVRRPLIVLLGAAGLLLVIASANVANLLLTRATTRGRELAVRLALGAGRGQLVGLFLVESALLALAGGMGGILLAFVGIDALLAFEPGRLPRVEAVGVDWAVLGFALAVSSFAAVGIGVAAAVRATGADVRQALAGRGGGQPGGISNARLRSGLVAAQVALTVVLLVGSGLLARSFVQLITLDPGYRTGGVAVLELTLPAGEGESDDPLLYGTPNRRGLSVLDEALERLRTLPGAEEVGGINAFPLSGGGADGLFVVLERPDEIVDFEGFGRLAKVSERTGYARYRVATPGYFEALRIPIVHGRPFDRRDGPDGPHVAVISESLARERWPGEDPIGMLIQFGNMDGDLHALTIVGVVGDVRDHSLETEPGPTVYANARQRTTMLGGPFEIAIGTTSDSAALLAPARRVALDLIPNAPVRLRTLEEVLSASLAERRFSLLLLCVFGATALLLAAMGIYGVISYLVSQRTREIGIRMALGARRESVLASVMRDGLALTLAGVGVGLIAAYAVARVVASQLYGVGTTDPLTFAGVALALGVVAALGTYVPARRAAKVDPMVALRTD